MFLPALFDSRTGFSDKADMRIVDGERLILKWGDRPDDEIVSSAELDSIDVKAKFIAIVEHHRALDAHEYANRLMNNSSSGYVVMPLYPEPSEFIGFDIPSLAALST